MGYFLSALFILFSGLFSTTAFAEAECPLLDWLAIEKVSMDLSDGSLAKIQKLTKLLHTRALMEGKCDGFRESIENLDRAVPVLEKKIEAQDPLALRLSMRLTLYGNGETQTRLSDAIASRISRNPTLFLTQAKAAYDGLPACGPVNFLDLKKYGGQFRLQRDELLKRQNALSRVGDQSLRVLRDRCLHEIQVSLNGGQYRSLGATNK